MRKHATNGDRFPHELEILRQMADGLPQILWVARPDGSYEHHNKPWYDYTGLTGDESTGEAWRELIHPDDREEEQTSWARSAA
jgi:PAS domain S-box-containing protein